MRLIMARTIKKMQVPAYPPEVVGVHWLEYSGVLWSLVKAMGIDIDMLLEDEELPMSMLEWSIVWLWLWVGLSII
jgi:hypothetical protein